MSNLISINIETLKSLSQSFSHNFRFQEPSYLIKNENKNVNIVYDKNLIELKPIRENFNNYQKDLEDKIKEDYFKHNKQKMQAKTILFKEALISFGRDAFEKNDINDINKTLNKFVEQFEKKYNVKVLSHSIHLDEGHINENGEKKHNYHAHFQIQNYDFNTHKTGMRKVDYKKLQTELSDCFKSLGFERGKNYSALQKIENDKAKEENRDPAKIEKPVHVKHSDYRRIMQSKELENQKKELKQVKLLKNINKRLNDKIEKDTEKLTAKQQELIDSIENNKKTISEQNTKIQTNANLLETRTKTNKDLMDGNQKLREEIEQQKIDIDSNNKLLEAQKKDIKPTSMLNLSVEQFERLEGKERVKIVNNLDKLININKNNNDLVQAEYFEKLKKDFETLLFYFYGKVNKDKQKIQPSITKVNRGKDLEIT
jgi:chromosome segregation ATPase